MNDEILLMRARGGGAIAHTASGAGAKGSGNGGADADSKSGAIGITKDAALDYAAQDVHELPATLDSLDAWRTTDTAPF